MVNLHKISMIIHLMEGNLQKYTNHNRVKLWTSALWNVPSMRLSDNDTDCRIIFWIFHYNAYSYMQQNPVHHRNYQSDGKTEIWAESISHG